MQTTNRAEIMSIRMPLELKTQVEALAKATTRRKSDLLISWISEKVEQEQWQLQKIEAGLADIESNNLATDDDINTLNQKWSINL
jgi:predicted transcriptional regulator